jgi:hypothetical protein
MISSELFQLGDHVKQKYHSVKAEQCDQKFDANEDDILDDLDLSTKSRSNQTQKRVNVDFPSWVIDLLDKEASRVGVTRQSII